MSFFSRLCLSHKRCEVCFSNFSGGNLFMYIDGRRDGVIHAYFLIFSDARGRKFFLVIVIPPGARSAFNWDRSPYIDFYIYYFPCCGYSPITTGGLKKKKISACHDLILLFFWRLFPLCTENNNNNNKHRHVQAAAAVEQHALLDVESLSSSTRRRFISPPFVTAANVFCSRDDSTPQTGKNDWASFFQIKRCEISL